MQAIGEISGIITISTISRITFASAVEEQSVTTNEIARNWRGRQRHRGNRPEYSADPIAAQNTTRGATDMQQAAQALSGMAAQLQAWSLNSRFLTRQ